MNKIYQAFLLFLLIFQSLCAQIDPVLKYNCIYDGVRGLKLKFQTHTEYDKYQIVISENQNKDSFLLNSSSSSCVKSKDPTKFLCPLLSYSNYIQVKHQKTVHVVFRILGEDKQLSKASLLANFTLTINKCFLAACKNVIHTAKVSSAEKRKNGRIVFKWNKVVNPRFNVATFVSTRELNGNKTVRYKKSLHNEYQLEDLCGFYNVCVTTQWKACLFNNTEEVFHHSDCRNVSMKSPHPKLSKPLFTCTFNSQNKNIVLNLRSNKFDLYKYTVLQNRKIIKRHKTNASKVSVPLPEVSGSISVLLSVCNECDCFANISTSACHSYGDINENSSYRNDVLIIVVVIGCLSVLVLIPVLVIYYRKRFSERHEDRELTEGVIIYPVPKYHEISYLGHEYNKPFPEYCEIPDIGLDKTITDDKGLS